MRMRYGAVGIKTNAIAAKPLYGQSKMYISPTPNQFKMENCWVHSSRRAKLIAAMWQLL